MQADHFKMANNGNEQSSPIANVENPLPLYFMNNDVENNNNLAEIDICLAMEDVITASCVIGCQKIRNLWRLYTNTAISRITLLQNGLNISNQHITVYSDNPSTSQDMRRFIKPVKILVKDVPMTLDNDSVQHMLLSNGSKLTSNVKYSLLRDRDGQLTKYTNGDRFVFADRNETIQNPLPRCILIGSFVARVIHEGQILNQPCSRCLESDHPTWRCKNQEICATCKEPGHIAGSTECTYFTENNNAYTFGGRRDPLGLSNFERCDFEYKNQKYICREIAYQHQKALLSGQLDLAEKIFDCGSPQEAKSLSRCLINDNQSNDTSELLMTTICLEAAKQDRRYRENILKTEDRIIVEAIPGQFVWSSGVTHAQTRRIQPDFFPGKNRMGNILMNIRKTLKDDEYKHITTWLKIVDNKEDSNIVVNATEFPTLTHPSNNINNSTPVQKPQIKRKPTSTPSGGNDRKVHVQSSNITENRDSIFNSLQLSDDSVFEENLNTAITIPEQTNT